MPYKDLPEEARYRYLEMKAQHVAMHANSFVTDIDEPSMRAVRTNRGTVLVPLAQGQSLTMCKSCVWADTDSPDNCSWYGIKRKRTRFGNYHRLLECRLAETANPFKPEVLKYR